LAGPQFGIYQNAHPVRENWHKYNWEFAPKLIYVRGKRVLASVGWYRCGFKAKPPEISVMSSPSICH
jgi:hypothetical protein